MTLQSTKIDQKEYLKRYLSGTSEEKKKKKKKVATGIKRVKIIDDDIDLRNMRNLNSNELELYQLSEDAPVIAGIVDERPPEVQLADKYKDKRWKVITGGSDDDIKIRDKNEPKSKCKITSFKNNSDSDFSPPRKSKPISKKTSFNNNSDSDSSPPKTSNPISKKFCSSNSPSHKSRKKSSDSDQSPPRKSSKKSRQNSNSDVAPPRKSNKKFTQDPDSDPSPPRQSRKKSRDYDVSPPRKSSNKSRRNSDSDISPPRKSSKQILSSSKNDSKRNKNDSARSPRRLSRKNSDSDLSPPRKSRKEKESNKNRTQSSRGNLSPQRKETKLSSKLYKSQETSDSDLSPPRKSKKDIKSSSRRSDRNDASDSDLSPPRKRQSDNRMKKTLDGKQAGLQDAKQLVQENQEFKQREDELFRKMKASVSGADANTVLRDRKTGKVRDLEEEARVARKRNEKDSEHKEKYDKWGRGVKQGQDFQARIAQDLHEMSKPLARYRDDDDLERDLKETLRAEDPMLQYVLSKREKTEADLKPKYKGAWPPNRFNIPPGYRWDGVDRSSGYEKQYFLSKSAKKATEEEAYHWSISDM